MDSRELLRIADQMLAFQPEIRVHGVADYQTFLMELSRLRPEVLYYIQGCQCSAFGSSLRFVFTYKNQGFPRQLIYSVQSAEIEDLLRQCVMRYERKLVLVLNKNVNLEWILECFMTRSVSFYPNTKSYSCSTSSFDFLPCMVCEVNFTYRIGTVMLRQMEMDVVSKLSGLRKELFPIPMPDIVKCYIAHNYLACTVTYNDVDHSSPLERSYLQSAYGALIRKQCVCQGFAEAYKRILEAEGIPCDLVSGKVLAEDEWHAWNMIHLDNGRTHCHVDVTWDADHFASKKTYFLKGDDFFAGKRDWKRHYYAACYENTTLLRQAQQFCLTHRQALLKHGLRPEWIN